jgi:hypothetical protein
MGGRYYEIKLLGVLEICGEIVVSNFLRGNTTNEFMDKHRTPFKKHWSTEGRIDNSKKKTRPQFSARYDKWLRLAWKFGSGHNGNNKKQ